MISGLMLVGNETKNNIYELTIGSPSGTDMYGAAFGYIAADNIGSLSPNDIDGRIIEEFCCDFDRGDRLYIYFSRQSEQTWTGKIIVKFIDYDNYEVHLYQDKISSNLFSSEVGSTLPQIFLENIGKTIRIMMRKEVRK